MSGRGGAGAAASPASSIGAGDGPGSPASVSGAAVDLLVVGAGPTGIAIGAEARRAGLSVLLVDRGPLTASLLGFPTYLTFFTTRDKLEIGGIPFAIPEEKPDRRQALAYYRAVAAHYRLPLALHEEVEAAEPRGGLFHVRTRPRGGGQRIRLARAVALATGYFDRYRRLGVGGEDLPWVHHRYREPYRHFGEAVAVIGGGNTAVEAALELWRSGVAVSLVHRGDAVKGTVKYWLRPDFENRVAEGAIAARYRSSVVAFEADGVRIAGPGGEETLRVSSAYVLVGYEPDAELERRCGVEVDPASLVPRFDPETCESNVPGLYLAGTLQAGVDTNRIFIENSRAHGELIVRHLRHRLDGAGGTAPEQEPAGAVVPQRLAHGGTEIA